eukprot:m51a1_g10155 hypothetical protein (320) ;mRNA; r:13633-15925
MQSLVAAVALAALLCTTSLAQPLQLPPASLLAGADAAAAASSSSDECNKTASEACYRELDLCDDEDRAAGMDTQLSICRCLPQLLQCKIMAGCRTDELMRTCRMVLDSIPYCSSTKSLDTMVSCLELALHESPEDWQAIVRELAGAALQAGVQILRIPDVGTIKSALHLMQSLVAAVALVALLCASALAQPLSLPLPRAPTLAQAGTDAAAAASSASDWCNETETDACQHEAELCHDQDRAAGMGVQQSACACLPQLLRCMSAAGCPRDELMRTCRAVLDSIPHCSADVLCRAGPQSAAPSLSAALPLAGAAAALLGGC